jgi:hypothetical protein
LIERREDTIGDNNDKYVEIKSGLKEGERVTLDARSRVIAETKAAEAKAPGKAPKASGTAKEKEKPPVPAAPAPQAAPAAKPPAQVPKANGTAKEKPATPAAATAALKSAPAAPAKPAK